MRPFAAITLFALTCGRASAQADDSGIVFEAASIKPFAEGAAITMSGCMGGPGSDDPGRINCEYTTLKMLLMRAYQVKSQEIFGPNWLDSAHFNIAAKLPPGATKEQVAVMFRNLLAERFKLALHHENRALPSYSLMVARGGLKIKESAQTPAAAASDDAPPNGGRPPIGKDGFPILRPAAFAGGPITLYRQGLARLQAGNTTLAVLAESLSHQLDRVVIDETGVVGKYDITLNWTPEATEPGGRARPAASVRPEGIAPQESTLEPDLFAAVEQQLGLKLVSKKIPRDTLMIDRAEKMPTEN
jgi:uncharacterized protein (TIGR03435 family)